MPTAIEADLSWVDELADPQKPGIIDTYAQVEIVNLGSELKWDYGGRRFVIPGIDDPHGRRNVAFIPYHMMVMYCGDPRAFNVPGDERRKFRTDQFQRLCVQYGVYENTAGHNPLLGDPHTNFPKVEVYSPTTRTRIITVLDDPEGDSMNKEALALNRYEQQRDLIQAQQRQLEHLQRQMDEMKRQDGIPIEDRGVLAMTVSDSPDIVPDDVDPDEPTVDDSTLDEMNAALSEGDDEKSDGPTEDTASTTVPTKRFGK